MNESIEILLIKLQELNQKYGKNGDDDNEVCHIKMDELLLEFIGDDRIIDAFKQEDKWYA